jgi:hypothetical protein
MPDVSLREYSPSADVSLPPIRVQMFAVQDGEVTVENKTCSSFHVGSFAEHLVLSDEVGPQSRPPSIHGVPLQARQMLCVSCMHPAVETTSNLSQNIAGETWLAPQQMKLSKHTDSPICRLAPGLQIRVLFCEQQSAAGGVPTQTHLCTADIPLNDMLKDLIGTGTYTWTTCTLEDDGQKWIMSLSMPPTYDSATARQHALGAALDSVQAHTGVIRQMLGSCETVKQAVGRISEEMQKRKLCCDAVLGKLSTNVRLPSDFMLEMSRALGTSGKNATPAQLDNQAMEHLRRGAAKGNQAQQTWMLLANALASTVVQIGQRRGVLMGFDEQTQLALFNAEHLHSAVLEHMRTNSAHALLDMTMKHCQEIICATTKYEGDPGYEIGMTMDKALIGPDGKGHIDFTSTIVKSKLAKEDQSITIGYDQTNQGVLAYDCEDLGNGNLSIISQMLSVDEHQLLDCLRSAISYLPPSVQQVSDTITSLGKTLHAEVTRNKQLWPVLAKSCHVGLDTLNTSVLRNTLTRASTLPSVVDISACSLMAQGPRMDNQASFNQSTGRPLAQSVVSHADFFKWWYDKKTGLCGHSVCTAFKLTPVLSTLVNCATLGTTGETEAMRVVVSLVDSHVDITEGTGVARNCTAPATRLASLNVGTATPTRVQITNRLVGVDLNTSQAANIASALCAREMVQSMCTNSIDVNNKELKALPLRGTEMLMTASPASPALSIPTVSAIQTFSLDCQSTDDTTAAARGTAVMSMFYAVALAGGMGAFFTFDTCVDTVSAPPRLAQPPPRLAQPAQPAGPPPRLVRPRGRLAHYASRIDAMKTSDNSATEDAEDATEATTDGQTLGETELASMKVFPGIPFLKGLLPEDTTRRLVVGAECSSAEILRLEALGQYLALRHDTAEQYVQKLPGSITPLHLRQAMCPSVNGLTPLSASQMQHTDAFSRGVFAKGPFIKPTDGCSYKLAAEMQNNMLAICMHTSKVTGCTPVITGTGISDSLMIMYA